MSSSLNSVDFFVIFIFALSMLLGFMRGLLKEVISLITWIAASAVSTLFASKLATVFGATAPSGEMVGNAITGASQGTYTHFLALGISFIVLFVGTLFAGFIVNTIIVGIMQGAFISLPNRLLGALFGLIRGFLVVIILMFLAELTPMGSQPSWQQSQFVKAFAPTVQWLQRLVQPGLKIIREKAEGALQGIKNVTPATGTLQGIMGGGAAPDTSSYSNTNP